MKFHNWFSYANVAEFQGVNHTAYEMYECPLCAKSGRSPVFNLSQKSTSFTYAKSRLKIYKGLVWVLRVTTSKS